jgi:hypothetical protein
LKADQPVNIAFCDTFAPGNRSGDLNAEVWGVSRVVAGIEGDHFHCNCSLTIYFSLILV